jgi:hypothetical protein
MTMARASIHPDGPMDMFDRGRWWVHTQRLATVPAPDLLSPFPYGVGIVAASGTKGTNAGRSGAGPRPGACQ